MKVEYNSDKSCAFFNGYKFRKDFKTGYYLSTKKTDCGKCERLHRYVWRYYNGEIPEGYHIHHLDENKSNNDIENLVCITERAHKQLHGFEKAEREYDWMIQNLNTRARPKASEWHGSKEGIEWHKQQYQATREMLHAKIERVCEYCGRKYITEDKGRNRFCSNNCKSAARRESRVDDETRKCVVCGKEFRTNKYSKAKVCSRRCRGLFRWNREHYESTESAGV